MSVGIESTYSTESKKRAPGAMDGTIVIIEDNEDDAYLIQRHLRKGGILNEVLSFESGSALLSHFGNHSSPVPLVIIALSLKIESGLDLLRTLRSHPPFRRSLILAIGNSTLPGDIQQALDLGANGYYAKVVDFNELADTVKNLEFIN